MLLLISSDIDGEYIAKILNEKVPDPREVHGILGMFIDLN